MSVTRTFVIILLGLAAGAGQGQHLETVIPVEGQGTRDPVSQPGPLQLAAEDSGKAESPQQGGASSGHGSASAKPDAFASYVAPVPQGTTAYLQLDAGLRSAQPNGFLAPDPSDSSPHAFLMRDFLRRPSTWGEVSLPMDIQQTLGDARVYVLLGGGNVREMWGLRGATYYSLPGEVNQFVVDGGQLWSADNAARLVRAYAFFLAADEHLSLQTSFSEYRFTRIRRSLVDSIAKGIIPLVPAFRVGSINLTMGTDTGPTPPHTVSRLTASIDWGGHTDHASVEFTGVYGYPGASFPEIWDWTGRAVPWGMELYLPFPPGRRGDAGNVEFEFDAGHSDGKLGTRIS